MTTENSTVSNATTPEGQGNDQGQNTVNPGAIRKSTTQSILKAASSVLGTELDSVETLMATLARVSAQNNTVVPSQPVETVQTKRTTTNDLQEQFVQLKQDLSRKEQALREKELDSDIRLAMGDRFDSDLVEYALTKVRSNIQWEDGSYSIVNSKGQVRYGEDGNPMTIKGLVEEVAKSNPKLLKSSNSTSGSGLKQMGGMFGGDAESMPDYATNPDAFNAWAQRNGLGKNVGLKGVKASVHVGSTSKRVV